MGGGRVWPGAAGEDGDEEGAGCGPGGKPEREGWWCVGVGRSSKLKLVNALLRLRHYFASNNGGFPEADELLPFYEEAQADHLARVAAARAAGEVHSLEEAAFAERFNLQGVDVTLRAAADPTREAARTAATAWGFYLRFLLKKNAFYAFEALKPGQFLLVCETKSVPNRPAVDAGDCQGRPLIVAWYELVGDAGGLITVTPCEVLGVHK